ncbi:hypothetical protein ACFTZI_05635 [Streptomyces decoyicus]|uniref:hypothetical protein n=1 Tax=Streptomyces decoyicus TaxID=249567 RepID=UPI003626913B
MLVPDGRPTAFVADKAWVDETFPVELGRPARTSAAGDAGGGQSSGGTAPADASTTARDEVPEDPRDRLARLRAELSARGVLVEGSYMGAVAAAEVLLADFEEARRLRVELDEEPLPAALRIEWMEKLAKARDADQASVSALTQVEKLILKLRNGTGQAPCGTGQAAS